MGKTPSEHPVPGRVFVSMKKVLGSFGYDPLVIYTKHTHVFAHVSHLCTHAQTHCIYIHK